MNVIALTISCVAFVLGAYAAVLSRSARRRHRLEDRAARRQLGELYEFTRRLAGEDAFK